MTDNVTIMSNNDWWYHNPTSVIQIAKSLSQDRKVLFVNSITFGMPDKKQKDFRTKIFRKAKSYMKFLRKADKNLYILSPIVIPTFGNHLISEMNRVLLKCQIGLAMHLAGVENGVSIVANPMFCDVIPCLKVDRVVYFVTDKYTAKKLADRNAVLRADQKMLELSNSVVCVSSALCRYYQQKHCNVRYIGHGVNCTHFAKAYEMVDCCPDCMGNISTPVVGFMGVIEPKTIDAGLLEYLFVECPDKNFVFIGRLSEELFYLTKYPNAYFLGQVSFDDLPKYLSTFDVALMPFNNSEWIKYCNPVKLKEYLAAGLAVVSINIREAEEYGSLIYAADSYGGFKIMIEEAISENSNELKKRRMLSVVDETWENKANEIVQ